MDDFVEFLNGCLAHRQGALAGRTKSIDDDEIHLMVGNQAGVGIAFETGEKGLG